MFSLAAVGVGRLGPGEQELGRKDQGGGQGQVLEGWQRTGNDLGVLESVQLAEVGEGPHQEVEGKIGPGEKVEL